jgi:CRISPR-associated protein Cmr1
MIYTEVKCRVVTPIISRKDPQTGKFDLTGQSVKGVLHFWFRAVAPRIIDIYKLNEDNKPKSPKENKELYELYKTYEKEKYAGLKLLENEIFGSQKKKAPFGVWVEYNTADLKQLNNGLNISKDLGGRKLNYALYGIIDRKNPVTSYYLVPSKSFTLNFTFKDIFTKKVILSLLKLTSLLGGFGAKTTNGFGGFEIVGPKEEIVFVKKLPKNVKLEKRIDETLAEVEQALRDFIKYKKITNNTPLQNVLILLNKPMKELLDFPNLCDDAFVVVNTEITANNIPDVFFKLFDISKNSKGQPVGWYKALKYYLRKRTKDGSDCVKELKSVLDQPEMLKMKTKHLEIPPALLGLPLQYYFPETKITAKFEPYIDNSENNVGRKQSPIRFTVLKNDNNQYIVYGILLKSNISAVLSNQYYKLRFTAKKRKETLIDKGSAYVNSDWNELVQAIKDFKKMYSSLGGDNNASN